jgi:hypothetical protein
MTSSKRGSSPPDCDRVQDNRDRERSPWKQEIANKRRIREHKGFKAAEERISQARRQGRKQGNSMGWDLDRGFTIENGVKRVWLADALPVGGQQQQQQEGDDMEVGGA